jgi:phosphoglycolate phosphatase
MACQQIGVAAENCMYVGDAERDMQAAKAAGMQAIVALFGYIDASDKPAEWGADVLIETPDELLKVLDTSSL